MVSSLILLRRKRGNATKSRWSNTHSHVTFIMPCSRLCGGLTLLAFIYEGIGFLYPALRAGNPSLWRRAGLVGAADSGCDGRAVIVPSKRGADASSRVPLTRTPACGPLMAKKRRRKRVEDAKPDGATAAPEPKLQGNVASAKDTTGLEEQEQLALPQEREVDESYEDGEDREDEDTPTLGAVLMPPLPSELGADAVRISQELQGEDIMSPVAYQPKPDVTDVEMMDGEEAGLLDETSTAKKSKYSFGLEVELPMESENREAGSLESALPDSPMTPDGVMPLPDLRDLAKKSRNKDGRKETKEVDEASKVERRNVEAFTKLLELDPEADSEEALFTSESYDAFSSILGEGKPFVGIANSYLQSGHTVLLGLVLLCGFVEQPGFPLTSLPYDVREFLKTGLLVVYVINTGIAILSYLEAKRVGQPAIFWAIKGFVLGGLAFNELSQIEPQKTRAAERGRKRRS